MAERNYHYILEVNDLYTSFNIPAGEVRSVNGVSFNLKKGSVLGIVGESGSGKSVTAYSIMQILQSPGRIVSGSIKYKGKQLIGMTDKQLQKIRGEKIAIIFQDPMSSLNPVYTVGNQMKEAIKLHPNPKAIKELNDKIDKAKAKVDLANKAYEENKTDENKIALTNAKEKLKQAKEHLHNFPYERALEMLKLVGINEPEKRMKQYPFEFSGGMLQRIMIAMALVCEPDILIADEPTTALDVTIQAQILELLKSIQEKMGMAIIIITHDLGVVAQICDNVAVMYAGRIVERGTVQEIFYNPQHEYTKGLMNSIPKPNDTRDRLEPIEGNPVDVFCLGKGCSFAPRCSSCMKICLKKYPARVAITEHHSTCCFKYIIEAYKKGEFTEEQLKMILSHSYEGNSSFTPVSRLDILDALNDYNIAEKKFKIAKKNKEKSEEELEQLEFQAKESKANYKRSKYDFKVAEKNRKFTKKEKPMTERIDMSKKTRSVKKVLKYFKDEEVNKKFIHDYFNNLEITSFPVDLGYSKKDVDAAKDKYKESKAKLKKVNGKDKVEKTEVLCNIDTSKIAYEKALEEFKRAKKVSGKLYKTRRACAIINAKRVSKSIDSIIAAAVKEYQERKLYLNNKELNEYLRSFKFANWDFDMKITKSTKKNILDRINKDHQLINELYNGKVKDNNPRKKILATTKDLNEAIFDYTDYLVTVHYIETKPRLFQAIKELNEKNSLKKSVVYKGGSKK